MAGTMGLSEALVLSADHSLADGGLLPIQFWGFPLLNLLGLPGSSDGKESACSAGDSGLIPG